MASAEIQSIGHGKALRNEARHRALLENAPKLDRKRIFEALLPTATAMTTAVVGLFSTLPGLVITALYIMHSAETSSIDRLVTTALYIIFFIVFPPPVIFMGISALIAKKPGSTTVMCAVGLLFVLFSFGSCALGTGMTGATDTRNTQEHPWLGGAMLSTVVHTLPVLVFAIPGVIYGFKTRRRLYEELVTERRERAQQLVYQYGSISLDELSLGLSMSAQESRALIEQLAKWGRIDARVDLRHGQVYRVVHLRSRQALVVELIERRGSLTLDELAAEVGEPQAIVSDWIAELRASGALGVRTDGETITFDPDGKGGATRVCEACGGPMRAVGRGLFHCEHCDAEAYS